MTRKLWFQLCVAILLILLIIKFFIEVNWIFTPILIVAKTIFIPILIAGVFFYITVPLQIYLEKHKIPRWGSISIIFLLLISLLTIAIVIIGPPITKQVNSLISKAPEYYENGNKIVVDLLEKRGELPAWTKDAIDSAQTHLEAISVKVGRGILHFAQSVVQGTIVLVLVPFFLLFMLKDHEKLIPFVKQFFIRRARAWVEKAMQDVDEVLSLYIRGQMLISFILAVMLFTGYQIIGLNFALLLAVFALFMNIIPFIGPWIAFIPALLIAYFQEPKLVFWVSLITLIAQQIDANLITPNVMGKALNIHPLTIITLLLAAGSIAGFLGILIAVPAYAVGRSIITNIYDHRRNIKETITKTV